VSDYGYCPEPGCRQPGVKRTNEGRQTKCLNGHWFDTERFKPPVPPRPLEANIETYFITSVERSGGLTRKVTWPERPGAPDRLAGWPNGKHGLVELKRPFGSAEPHQVREHGRLRAIGLRVDIISTKDEVDAYVKEMSA